MVGFVLGIAGIGAALVPAARDLENQLPQMAARIEMRVDALRTSLRSLQEAKEKFDRATQIGADPKQKVQVSTDAGGGPGVLLFQTGLFAVLTYFLLAARLDFRRRLIMSRQTTTERLLAARTK